MWTFGESFSNSRINNTLRGGSGGEVLGQRMMEGAFGKRTWEE